jgi:hypothetical protein
MNKDTGFTIINTRPELGQRRAIITGGSRRGKSVAAATIKAWIEEARKSEEARPVLTRLAVEVHNVCSVIGIHWRTANQPNRNQK